MVLGNLDLKSLVVALIAANKKHSNIMVICKRTKIKSRFIHFSVFAFLAKCDFCCLDWKASCLNKSLLWKDFRWFDFFAFLKSQTCSSSINGKLVEAKF